MTLPDFSWEPYLKQNSQVNKGTRVRALLSTSWMPRISKGMAGALRVDSILLQGSPLLNIAHLVASLETRQTKFRQKRKPQPQQNAHLPRARHDKRFFQEL